MKKIMLYLVLFLMASNLFARSSMFDEKDNNNRMSINVVSNWLFSSVFNKHDNKNKSQDITLASDFIDKNYYFKQSSWRPKVFFPELKLKYTFTKYSYGLSIGYAWMRRTERYSDAGSISSDINNDGIADLTYYYYGLNIKQEIRYIPVYGLWEMEIISNYKTKLFLEIGLGINFLKLKEEYKVLGETISYDYSADDTVDATEQSAGQSIFADSSKITPYGRFSLGFESKINSRISIHSSIGMQYIASDLGKKNVEKLGEINFGRWNLSGEVFNIGFSYYF